MTRAVSPASSGIATEPVVGRWLRVLASLALGLSLAGPPSGHCSVPGFALDDGLPPAEFEAVLTDARDRRGLRRDTWYLFGEK